jgi:phosphatidylglycerophosphatase A
MAATSLSLLIAQLGGLGKARFAPGTVATVFAGIPSVYLLSLVSTPWSLWVLGLLFISSCCFAGAAETELRKTDPAEVVIDELVGFLITMFGFPLTLHTLVLGLLSFRLLDILKPWPIRMFQEGLKGGVAIVMDDVAAGVLAHVVVWAGLKIWD